jgi:16S rRNA (cytosine1402-N4)-methyltransferase
MSNFIHTPVMTEEVLAALNPQPRGCYADGTIGGGGHAFGILKFSTPEGQLYGCDRDIEAVEAARCRLAEFEGRFEIRHGNFSEMPDWVGSGTCDGVLLDLGMSSPQIDQAERGFSFQLDGPLDMRMDQRQPMTAANLVNEASAEELALIFWEFGGERESRRLARGIIRERERSSITRTKQLADLIERMMPRRGQKTHPATRVFQALRIAINDELGLLSVGLAAVWKLIKPGGRLVVITFHSLEDRIVKDFGRKLARDYRIEGNVDVPELRQPATPESKWVYRKAVQPGTVEITENPRARSAQMRVMEKI